MHAGRFLALIAALLVAALAVHPFDAMGSAWARSWGGGGTARVLADQWVGILHLLGKGEVALLAALLLGAAGYRREAAHALLALVVVAVVVTACKLGIARPRPNGAGGWSFPSGDAATASALAAALWAGRGRRWWWLLPAAGVAYGRCHDGYHYPADVLAGAAVGAAATLVGRVVLARRPRLPGAAVFLAVAAVAAVAIVAAQLIASQGHHSDAGRFLLIAGPCLGMLIVGRPWRAWGAPTARWAGAGVIAVLLMAGLGWLAATTTLWDRDEPRFAQASIAMLHRHAFLVPTFNGEWRLHKPSGIYWLMAACVRCAGATAWAVRLPAILAAGALVLLTAWIGRRWWNEATGRRAAGILACTPLLLVCGQAATTDAVLVAAVTAAFAIAIASLPRAQAPAELRWTAVIGIGLAMAGALLVKGPMGLMPAYSWLVLRLLARDAFPTTAGYWWRGGVALALALALFAAWGIPANQATGGAFLHIGIGKHVLARGAEAMEGHRGPVFYYVPVVVATFFPWTAFLPAAIRWLVRQPRLTWALLTAWTVPTFLLFSCFATKLPHYILPIFPALALLVAAATEASGEGGPAGTQRRWRQLEAWLLAAPAVLGALTILLAPAAVLVPVAWLGRHGAEALTPLHHLALVPTCAALGLCLVTLAGHGGRLLLRGRRRAAQRWCAAAIAGLVVVAGGLALPQIERLKPAAAVAEEVATVADATTPVWLCEYDEPSLHFALHRDVVPLLDPEGVVAWAQQPGPGVVVLPQERLDRARAAGGLLHALGPPIEGLDLANGHWVRLAVAVRGSR